MKMRRKMMAVLAGLLVFGLVSAAAATLGGLNIQSLGAESEVVAACDPDGINVEWSTSLVGLDYVVDGVTLSDVDEDCAGLDVEVTLFDSTNAVLATLSEVADASGSVSFPVTNEPAADIVHIAVLITG